jgi:hypothetical protein
MITIFCDFHEFSAKKISVRLKNQCYDPIFAKNSSSVSKNRQNIFKIITSVPDQKVDINLCKCRLSIAKKGNGLVIVMTTFQLCDWQEPSFAIMYVPESKNKKATGESLKHSQHFQALGWHDFSKNRKFYLF